MQLKLKSKDIISIGGSQLHSVVILALVPGTVISHENFDSSFLNSCLVSLVTNFCVLVQLWVSGVSGSAAEERSQSKLSGHLWLHPSAPSC